MYKSGFAPSQEEYDENVVPLFGSLNKLEKIVSANGGPFILGSEMTELDITVYATLVRFDTVYVQHFKCNLGTIRHDYPVLNNWLKGVYWGVQSARDSTDFKHIKENVSLYISSPPAAGLENFQVFFGLMRCSIRRVITTLTQRPLLQWDLFRMWRMVLSRIGGS